MGMGSIIGMRSNMGMRSTIGMGSTMSIGSTLGMGSTKGMGLTMSLCFRPARRRRVAKKENDDGRKSRFVDLWLSRR